MSRAIRIEYPGAWYHVMNRGRRGEKICKDQEDYRMFVDLLEETSEMWNIRVAAYCLMPNHYHILIQTPDANISRSMRHINGVYTQKFNRKHSCDAQLFRGRYKSILVSEEELGHSGEATSSTIIGKATEATSADSDLALVSDAAGSDLDGDDFCRQLCPILIGQAHIIYDRTLAVVPPHALH